MTTSTSGVTVGGLSIGEVARLAGVTPRAVRHYHATGLLSEPRRDSSGYRRYDAEDLVAVVRVARLRALGMPLAQIASELESGDGAASLPAAMQTLADELDREIGQLCATRDRLRDLAASGGFDQPGETLTRALGAHGLVPPADVLPTAEHSAAALLDALHPQGITGVVDQAGGLLGDRVAMRQLGELLERFRALTDETSESDVESLADRVAAVLPRPANAAPPVNIELMDKLLGDRLNRAQRDVMHRLRRKLALRDG